MRALPRGAAGLRRLGAGSLAWSGWDLPKELEFLDHIVERTARKRWIGYLAERPKNNQDLRSLQPSAAKVHDLHEAMPVGDAAALLGTDTRRVIHLFPTWHLSRSHGLNGKPTTPRVVLRGSVLETRRLLGKMNHPWIDEPTSQYISFDEATHGCSLLDVPISTLVAALMEGSVRMCTPDKADFSFEHTLVNETDFCAFLRQAVQGPSRLVRAHVARQLLKLNTRTFEQLITENILSIEPRANGNDRKVALELVFGLLGTIRLAHRIEEFCGIGREALRESLHESGASLLVSRLNAGSGRHLRLVSTELLLIPRVLHVLKEGARRKWL